MMVARLPTSAPEVMVMGEAGGEEVEAAMEAGRVPGRG